MFIFVIQFTKDESTMSTIINTGALIIDIWKYSTWALLELAKFVISFKAIFCYLIFQSWKCQSHQNQSQTTHQQFLKIQHLGPYGAHQVHKIWTIKTIHPDQGQLQKSQSWNPLENGPTQCFWVTTQFLRSQFGGWGGNEGECGKGKVQKKNWKKPNKC